MAQIILDGLYIITILQGKDSECMPQIVHPAVGGTDSSGDLFIVTNYRRLCEVLAQGVGEYQRLFCFFRGLPAFSSLTSKQAMLHLFVFSAL